MAGTLHVDQYTFLIISRSVLLIIRKFWDKSYGKNQNTYFIYNKVFFSFENRAFYEIMWKNILEPGRPQMTVWHLRIACWIPKAKNTHS